MDYRSRTIRLGRAQDSVHSEDFWGLDVPDVGGALRGSRSEVVLVPGWHTVTFPWALWWCRGAGVPVPYRGDTYLGKPPAGLRGAAWALKTQVFLLGFDRLAIRLQLAGKELCAAGR